jgi:hypothetical protein
MVVGFNINHIKVQHLEHEQRQKRKQSLHASMKISGIQKHEEP